jgi:hypothetical protein
MTVFMEKCLYMRPYLSYVRKAGSSTLSVCLTYDRTGGGTQESSIQYPQCWYPVGGKAVKWGVRPHGAKARYNASNILSVGKLCFGRARR